MSIVKEGISGTQKVAIVLMNMDQEGAARVMQQFTDTEAEDIAAEIVRLRRVDSLVAERALNEFHSMTVAGERDQRGGADFATGLLEASFGAEKAAGVMGRVVSAMGGKGFEFLDAVDSTKLIHALDGEMPQTMALILAHLRPEHASAVLGGFPPEIRIDVAQCIATMGTVTPETISIVAESLKARTGASVAPREAAAVVGGVQPLVEIINRADVATERALLDALEARDPLLAEEVRSRMITFADILKFAARDVQQILRGIDMGQLSRALKGAPDAIAQSIKANLSERNRESLEEEITNLGAVRSAEVDDAKAVVVRNMRALVAEGTISMQVEGEDDDLVD